MVGSVPDESADGGEEPPGSEGGGGDGGVEAGLGSSGDDVLPLLRTGDLRPALRMAVAAVTQRRWLVPRDMVEWMVWIANMERRDAITATRCSCKRCHRVMIAWVVG